MLHDCFSVSALCSDVWGRFFFLSIFCQPLFFVLWFVEWRLFIHFRDSISTIQLLSITFNIIFNDNSLLQRFSGSTILEIGLCMEMLNFHDLLSGRLIFSADFRFEHFEWSLSYYFILFIFDFQTVVKLLLFLHRTHKIKILKFILLLTGRTHFLFQVCCLVRLLVLIQNPLNEPSHLILLLNHFKRCQLSNPFI